MEIRWKDAAHPGMNVNKKDGVVFLTFPALEKLPFIRHGFSTRLGGVSEGVCASMNLSFAREADADKVRENFRRIGSALGIRPEQMVGSMQTHTRNVITITGKDAGNAVTRPQSFRDVDGMITAVPGLALVTYFADCVPLYFVDLSEKVIGLAHSGWKGTCARIGEAVISRMAAEFGCRSENILAAIGPSICQSCYEVSEDVARAFREEFREPGACERILMPGKAPDKSQLDLWEANRQVLLSAGILPQHIQTAGLCTCCNPDFLFSHRASSGKRGNLAAFLMLDEKAPN